MLAGFHFKNTSQSAGQATLCKTKCNDHWATERPRWTAGSQCCTWVTRLCVSSKSVQYLAAASWILKFLTPASTSSLTTWRTKWTKISFWYLFLSCVSSEIHKRAEHLPRSMEVCCPSTAQGLKTSIPCENFSAEIKKMQPNKKKHYLLQNSLEHARSIVLVTE